MAAGRFDIFRWVWGWWSGVSTGAVGGPYRVEIGELRVTGQATGEIRVDGTDAGEILVAGRAAGQVDGRSG